MVNFNKTRIPLFRRFVLQNFPFIEQDFDALTDYELICKVVVYLNKVIVSTNANSEQVEILTNAYNDLQSYVVHYFDNLDVQDEINNKLDAMAEDSTLADLLANSSFKSLDVKDNYSVITRKITDVTRTLVYHKTILRPKNAEYVALKGLTCADTVEEMTGNPISMFDFMLKKPNIFMSNSDSIGSFSGTHAIIRDGQVIKEGGTTSGDTLAINNQGVINIFDGNITSTQLLADNYVNSWGCSSLIRDGAKDIDASEAGGLERHPRTIVLQEYNSKDIIFLHIEGRKSDSVGATFDEAANLIIEAFPDVRCACSLGGGGDSQLMIKGRMVNDSSDKQLRPLYDVFYLDPNLTAFTNPVSEEIVEGRISDVTMKDFLKHRVNLLDNYLYSRAIVNAEYVTTDNGRGRFICNLDYNISLKPNDTIMVLFPNLDPSDIDFSSIVTLNIHYASQVTQVAVVSENGSNISISTVNNRTVVLKWDGTQYQIVSTSAFVQYGGTRDLDEIKELSMYYSGNFTNKPSVLDSSEAGLVISLPLSIYNYGVQIYVARPSGRIFTRILENGVWKGWILFIGDGILNAGNKDLNTLVDHYYRVHGNNMTNKPTGAANGWAINLPGNTSGYNAQFYIERKTSEATGRIYLRQEENGTWSEWRQIVFAS